MKKNRIIYMKGTHRNFNMYIGNKNKMESYKEPDQNVPEKIIPIDDYLKK
ncbi:hypothetical protein NST62_06005 [Ureibacillus sp. FSL K6-8385]|nr:hypothetical protein [Ureibacillus terrenus]MED3660843.1 hypothetical protein [Ureibacillus terrenus]MED3763031.1 hypothetical protein [Ureibacillus terrenus]